MECLRSSERGEDASDAVENAQWSNVREMLECLGKRQEELFSEVFDQQKELRDQLIALRSTSKVNSAEKYASQPGPEGLRSPPRMSLTRSDIVTDEQPGMSQGLVTFEDDVNTDGTAADPVPMVSRQSTSSHSHSPKHRHESALQLHASTQESLDLDYMSRFSLFLQSRGFEVAIASAIMLNALFMCWECQYFGLDVGFNLQYPGREVPADKIWQGVGDALIIFEWFFGIIFLVEMLVKLLCWRHKYFYDLVEEGPSDASRKRISVNSNFDPSSKWQRSRHACMRYLAGVQGWNLLDFACVVAFLVGRIARAAIGINPQMLRMLRLFRLFRLVRLLRFLEALGHLYIMTTAITSMSSVLLWAIILLTVMLMTCSLLLVQILQATYFNEVDISNLDRAELHAHHKVYEYFGTCTRCMLSMFEITLGNWPPVARILSEEVSQWFTLLCVMHKLTIGFAVVGVINGVILQETFKVAQTDDLIMFRQKKAASRVLRKKMQALFESLDEEQDGKLQQSEFVTIADDPDIKLWLSSLDIETDDLKTLFELIDEDGNGHITLEELMRRVPRIKGAARSIDMLALQQKVDPICTVYSAPQYIGDTEIGI